MATEQPSNLPDNLQELQDSRESVYGPWQANMAGTSLQIDGMLQNYIAANDIGMAADDLTLPEWWTPLCMCAVKLNRIASGHYHEDSFKDLRVYLSFVERMQKQEQR